MRSRVHTSPCSTGLPGMLPAIRPSQPPSTPVGRSCSVSWGLVAVMCPVYPLPHINCRPGSATWPPPECAGWCARDRVTGPRQHRVPRLRAGAWRRHHHDARHHRRTASPRRTAATTHGSATRTVALRGDARPPVTSRTARDRRHGHAPRHHQPGPRVRGAPADRSFPCSWRPTMAGNRGHIPGARAVSRADGHGQRTLLRLRSQRRDCLDASKARTARGKVADAAQAARHVLIAADKFKGSLTAVQVAQRVTAGLHRVVPGVMVESVPVADGGDQGPSRRRSPPGSSAMRSVTGPLGEPVTAAYAPARGHGRRGDGGGVRPRLLPEGVFAPLTSTTYGSGEVIAAALDAGARSIVFGVGGSATPPTAARACSPRFGARFPWTRRARRSDQRRRPGGTGLGRPLRPRPRLADVEIVLASDVGQPALTSGPGRARGLRSAEAVRG